MINIKNGGGFVSNREWHKMPKAHITHTAEPNLPYDPSNGFVSTSQQLREKIQAVPVFYKTRRATHRLPAGSWVPLVNKPNFCRRVTP